MKKIKVDFNIDGELLSFISFKFEIFSQLRLQGARHWAHCQCLSGHTLNVLRQLFDWSYIHVVKLIVKLTAHESSYESRNPPCDTIFHHIPFSYETNENVILTQVRGIH